MLDVEDLDLIRLRGRHRLQRRARVCLLLGTRPGSARRCGRYFARVLFQHGSLSST
jgi:hypothetical protein